MDEDAFASSWTILGLVCAAGLGGAAVGAVMARMEYDDRLRGEKHAAYRKGWEDGVVYGRTDAELYPSLARRMQGEEERRDAERRGFWKGHGDGREAERAERGLAGPSRPTLTDGSMWRPR